MSYPTPESLRKMANESMDHVPADIRERVREAYRLAADALEQRGFYTAPPLFLITEAKALEVELRGIRDADEDQVPGWRVYFEGKVRVNDAGTDLEPVLAMQSTENRYGTHKAAVIDCTHAIKRAGLQMMRPTKAQKQQPVYILPSYLGVATDRYGNVIGGARS
jgi:hypothetical protein